jgi:hypothetical protein
MVGKRLSIRFWRSIFRAAFKARLLPADNALTRYGTITMSHEDKDLAGSALQAALMVFERVCSRSAERLKPHKQANDDQSPVCSEFGVELFNIFGLQPRSIDPFRD